jgi:hypothetical protein
VGPGGIGAGRGLVRAVSESLAKEDVVNRVALWSSLSTLLLASGVSAQPAPAPTPPPDADADADADTDAGADEPSDEAPVEEPEEIDLAERAQELTDKIAVLESRLDAADENRRSKFPIRLSGYGDLGMFTTQGDGSGFRRDIGHTIFPEYSNIGWVFYGDLLATQINSRGDVADLGEPPGVDRFDSVNSEGNTTFLVNELNVGIDAGLGPNALFTSSINFTPRTGNEFSFGDSFDVDLVQLEWQPTDDGKTSLFVGKVDSVLGIEYKERKAPNRFGITPTLLARYTTGTAVGLKARTFLLGDRLVLSAAVTNGSFTTEQFHFFTEVDTNNFKTLSGRAAIRFPVGDGVFELGPSGSWGTQDGASDDGGKMWFVGVDAELALTRLAIKAQWLKGEAPGDEVNMVYALDLNQGAYVEANAIITPTIGVIARAEFRDAEIQQGTDRLYITKNWRATGGIRLVLNPHAIVKAEYAHNGEYDGQPSIPDDLVTTSAVIAF